MKPNDPAWIVYGYINQTGSRVVLGEHSWWIAAFFRRWWLNVAEEYCTITIERWLPREPKVPSPLHEALKSFEALNNGEPAPHVVVNTDGNHASAGWSNKDDER